MTVKKILFFVLFFMTILRSQGFSGHDDGVSVYIYNRMPGCACFYHCDCCGTLREFLSLDGKFVKELLYPENKIWHEFMKKYLRGLSAGPYFPYDIRDMLRGNNPGEFICLLSEYLNAIDDLKRKQEITRVNLIEVYKKEYERSYKKPKDRNELLSNIERINRQAKTAAQILSTIPETIIPLYKELIECCPHKEPYNMVLIYNRGLLSLLEGKTDDSLIDIITFIDLAKINNQQNLLSSELFQKQGEAFSEVGLYHESIKALDQAIAKNPKNLEAYFHRASSYFEIGDFDQALSDYLVSKKTDHFVLYPLPPNEFIDAFSEAVFRGAGHAASEFIPSLCNTAYGISECLWIFSECPLECIQDVASASYAMGECAVDYLKTIDRDKLSSYADELVSLYERYDQLSLKEKGDLIGYTIGKYGVEIFAGSAVLKGVSTYKQLKTANTICNFESMIAKESAKQSIISRGLEHQTKKTAFFENTKIQWDRQNKHVPGKHNYREGKSIFEHHDAETLLRKYAGTGSPKKGKMGQAGYQEVVDFKEHIGIWRTNKDNRILKSTTKGTIHYSKDSAHIVPEHPDYKIWRSNGE